MNKRQAKKYKTKKVVDMMVKATTNTTVEEHKSGKLSNTKRIKHYTTMKPARFRPVSNKFPKRPSKAEVEKDTGGFGVKVVVRSHRTRAEYFRDNRLIFISQFMARLKEQFPDAPHDKVNAIYHWLQNHDSETIDLIMGLLDETFREMYYESASRYHYEGRDMDEFIDEFLEVAGQIDSYGNNEVLD